MTTASIDVTAPVPASHCEEGVQYALHWRKLGVGPSEVEEGRLGMVLLLGTRASSQADPWRHAGWPCAFRGRTTALEEGLGETVAMPVPAIVPGRHADLTLDHILVVGRPAIVDLGGMCSGGLQVVCVDTLREEDTFVLAPVETADPDLALAGEFGVSAALFRKVRAIVSETIKGEQGLSLSVDRLVDPEIGRPVQLVFEVRGAASAEDVTRIWETINSRIESLAGGLGNTDFRSLVDHIGVHVHRA